MFAVAEDCDGLIVLVEGNGGSEGVKEFLCVVGVAVENVG